MKLFIFTILAMLTLAGTANANGPWKIEFQNVKLPSQAMLEHRNWLAPAAASATKFGSAVAISSTAATTITTFSVQPDFSRNVVLTPTGTTSHVGAGTAVVSGTNIFGKAISENFTITSTQSTATTGAKAFKTITSIVFPQASGTGVTLSIGSGVAMGLIHCVDDAGKYVFSEFGGVYETTRGTLAVSSTAVESNTFAPHSAQDGSSAVDLYYVQNFRCYGQ